MIIRLYIIFFTFHSSCQFTVGIFARPIHSTSEIAITVLRQCVCACTYLDILYYIYTLYLHWDIPNPSPSPRSTNAQPSRPSRGHTALRPSAWSPYASSGASWWKLGSSSRENAKKGLVFAAKFGFFRENSRDFIGIYDKKISTRGKFLWKL